MHSHGVKFKSPLTRSRDAADCSRLEQLFPALSACPETHSLALRPYLNICPERFFNRTVYALMLDWLKRRDEIQRDDLRAYVVAVNAELSTALLFLREINAQDWHERALVEGEDYDVIRFIDKVVHPVYLRLVEGILAPLIRPIAHFMRLDRRKSTDKLDIFNLCEELSGTSMAPCIKAYRHTVRNGVGHGGITYLLREIRYCDKKGNEETLDVWSVIRLCDDMIDTCNGLACAFKVFLCLFREHGYQLPREFLVEELMEETRSPFWHIEGCIESEIGSSTQLVIYAHPNSRDYRKVLLAAMQSAVLAESLAPGYGRYFFSLRTPMSAWPGWAAFDGDRLRQLRLADNAELDEYASALEKGNFFYRPRLALPIALLRLETLVQCFLLHWPLVLHQIRENFALSTMVSRNAHMHRNAWGYVLVGAVVMTGLDFETAADVIRSDKRRIIRTVAKQGRATTSWFDITRYLPLGYARISVFSVDFRCRRLSSFGLGEELVCTIQLQRIRRIRQPDIFGSTIEVCGKWRIAWNRAWLERGGRIVSK